MRGRELDPGASPAAFFGNEVRFARTSAGMSQPELGAATGYDPTYVSKAETGSIVPDTTFIEGLDRVFPHYNGWFSRFWQESRKWDGPYRSWFRQWIDAEGRATVVRWWEPLLIPGPIQTPDYARELFRAWQTVADPDRVEQDVAARIKRQEIFGRPDPPTFLAVIDETVLNRCIGSPAIMRAQLEHIIDMTEAPNISVHIVPTVVGGHVGLTGAFAVADLESSAAHVIYLETSDVGMTSDSPSLAAKILGKFEMLRSEALSKRASRDLMRKVATEKWAP